MEKNSHPRLSHTRLVIALFAVSAALGGCGRPNRSSDSPGAPAAKRAYLFEKSGLAVDVAFAGAPKRGNQNSMTLTFDGAPAEKGLKLNVITYMPTMSHTDGAEVDVVSPTVIAVRKLVFRMPGDWIVALRLLTPEGSVADTISIPAVIE